MNGVLESGRPGLRIEGPRLLLAEGRREVLEIAFRFPSWSP